MADSSVNLASATGNVDVRSESSNGDLRQVVVLGDPSTNAGVAPVDGTLGLATFFKTQPTVSVVGNFIPGGGTLTAYQGGNAWLTTQATLPVVTNVTGYALESGGNLDSIITTLNNIKTKTDNLDVTLGSRLASGGTLPITGTINALNAGGSLTAFQGGNPWQVTFATIPAVVNVNNSSIPVTQSGTWAVQPGNTPNTTAWLVTMGTLPITGSLSVAGQATVTAIQGDPGTKAWLATLATLPVVTNVTGYALESGGNLDSIITTLNAIKLKTDNLDVTLGSRLGSGATLPITGTIGALNAGGSLSAFQGGTWTMQPGNTPNTTAWLVTFATIPVVTSVNIAGQATVTAIQGDPGTKAWLMTLATLPVNIGTPSILAAGGSLSAAQLGSWSVGQSGTWTVQPGNTPNTVGWLTTQATLPVVANINNTTLAVTQSGTWDEVGINDSGNSITVDNGGTFVIQENGAALTALQLIDNIVQVEDAIGTGGESGAFVLGRRRDTDDSAAGSDGDYAQFTFDATRGALKVEVFDGGDSHTVDYATTGSGTATGALRVELPTNGTGVVGLNAGTNNIGDVDAIQSGTWTVQPGNTPNSTPWLTTDTPATSGGLSKFHLVGAASDNATNVKASAGQVYSITAFNVASTPRYLKFHNTAGTPTAGTAVTDTFLIPGNTSGAGVVLNIDKGIAFGTGIGISIVTGIADNNTTAIGASEVVVNIYYK